MERLRRQVEQGVDLCDGAIDAPASTHLAPVEDELLFDWREFFHISVISVYTEISKIDRRVKGESGKRRVHSSDATGKFIFNHR